MTVTYTCSVTPAVHPDGETRETRAAAERLEAIFEVLLGDHEPGGVCE